MGLYLKSTQPMRVCGLSGKSKALHATPYFVDSCTLFGVANQILDELICYQFDNQLLA